MNDFLWYRITSPYFCSGVIFDKGHVAYFAPILKYMKGWTPERVEQYAKSKGWEIEYVGESKDTAAEAGSVECDGAGPGTLHDVPG